MDVWRGLSAVPRDVAPGSAGSAVTVGNFDGVHRGHRAIIAATIAWARAHRMPAVAVTFWPHPATIHRPDAVPPQITSLGQRLELLGGTGLDATLVLPYTADLARLTYRQFALDVLVARLGMRALVLGSDARMGRDNLGDVSALQALGEEPAIREGGQGFEVVAIADAGPGAAGSAGGTTSPAGGPRHDVGARLPRTSVPRWSSTAARAALASGDVSAAAAILGRDHELRGTVVHGEGRGHGIGFPTANLGRIEGMVPADGVYAGVLVVADGPEAGQRYPTAVSIGTNPTFDGVGRTVEAHVPGRSDLELYGRTVVVELHARLRAMERFASVDELIAQMRRDCERAVELVGARV